MQRLLLLLGVIITFVGCDARVIGIDVNPEKFDYGQVFLGDMKEMHFYVKNLSEVGYQINRIEIIGSNKTEFYISSGGIAPKYISPKESFNINVMYKPNTPGIHQSILQLTHTGPTQFERIVMFGEGVAVARISSDTSDIDFGTVYLGRSKVETVTITNIGTDTLNLTSFNFSNPAIPVFTIKSGGNVPIQINPGASHNVEIEFTPAVDVNYSNALMIGHNAVNEVSPLSVNLKGNGVIYSPEIDVTQTSPWDIGSNAITIGGLAILEIKSVGVDALTVTSITLNSNNEFTINSFEDDNGNAVNLPTLIQPGSNIYAKIDFMPSALVTYNDTISIVHDGINTSSPINIDIEGKGRNELTQTFSYTGAMQTWNVPAGVGYIVAECYGAEGGQPSGHGLGGKGGMAKAKVPVTPGGTVQVYVGQKPNTLVGGFNGGGTGCLACTGAGGGGASDIRVGGNSLSDRKVVGGGGGGGGYNFPGYGQVEGGDGGGLTGDKGTAGYGPGPGYGGTQSAGGAAGNSGATAGTFGVGGNGIGRSCGGGGGGGGWYGGGGAYCDGGGGGSSYHDAAGNTDKSTQKGVRSGHGEVLIRY